MNNAVWILSYVGMFFIGGVTTIVAAGFYAKYELKRYKAKHATPEEKQQHLILATEERRESSLR